jgi:hypothetical protein
LTGIDITTTHHHLQPLQRQQYRARVYRKPNPVLACLIDWPVKSALVLGAHRVFQELRSYDLPSFEHFFLHSEKVHRNCHYKQSPNRHRAKSEVSHRKGRPIRTTPQAIAPAVRAQYEIAPG